MIGIGVIGPTNTSLIEGKIDLPGGTLESASRHLGAFLAENSLALVSVPARGVGLWVLENALLSLQRGHVTD